MNYTAEASADAAGYNQYGGLVTTNATATGTSTFSQDDASTIANEIAQKVANSTLTMKIGVINQAVATSVSVIDTFWKPNGSDIYYSAGNVGINTSTPTAPLDVSGSLITTSDSNINGVTIGKGGGNIDNNTASGYLALFANTTGYYNTASGYLTLSANTTGEGNTAFGANSLPVNTTGNENTAFGNNALLSNTTGNYNTATSHGSLKFNTTGSDNTADGYQSLRENTTGSYNTASGFRSLFSNTTGSQNTSVGYNSLYRNNGGSQNTAIGYGADVLTGLGDLTNCTSIGFGAICDASNSIVLGNSSVTSLSCAAPLSSLSDQRDKKRY